MLFTNDLLMIEALARTGKPKAAAEDLNIHLATVYRRLKELEQEAGAPLFQKLGGRYTPTQMGNALVSAAAGIQTNLAEARRQFAGGDQHLNGTVAVTTTDSLVPLVAPILVDVRRRYKDIRFDLIVSNSFADMSRYEAELAIRPTRTPPETLIGKRAGSFLYGIYASEQDTTDLPWIVLDDSLATIPSARWLASRISDGEVVLRVNSMWAAAQAAAAGLGKALLPAYLGQLLGLVQEGEFIEELESEVWLLMHPDLRRTPRIRAFMDIAASNLRAEFSHIGARSSTAGVSNSFAQIRSRPKSLSPG